MSDLTSSLPQFLPNAAAARRIAIPSRPLKIVMACCVAALGLYGICADRQYVSTTDAVVSAYVLDVRTPIEGTLRDVPATAGDEVASAALLGRVGNDLQDHQHLDNLRITEEAARSKAEALARERATLEAVRRSLLARAAQHTAAMTDRLQQQVAQAQHALSARQTVLDEAEVELERGRKLQSLGVISRAAFDKLAAAHQESLDEAQAQRAAVASVQAQLTAARNGVIAEPGANNDVAYSAQRADELAIKLAEADSEWHAAHAQADAARFAVEQERKRSLLLGDSEVRAPSAGRVWKLYAISGEHMEADAPVMSMVDCSRQFVIARVPQDRVATLALNSRAEVKLTGETVSRVGTVMTISGDGANRLDAKLAAAPMRPSTEDVATVVIRLDGPQRGAGGTVPCLIGRTARVRIATEPTNLLSLWLAQRL